MRSTKERPEASLDPVEVLLRRIVLRGLAGTLFGGCATLGVGCATQSGGANTQNTEPVTSGQADGGDAQDARAPQTEPVDGALGPNADASRVDPSDAASGSPDGGPSGGLLACTSRGQRELAASGLHLAQIFDYVAVRELSGGRLLLGGDQETWTQTNFTTLSETGTPCATASSPACAAKEATHPAELVAGTCSQLCVERSVVTTRGDDVQRWAGPERLRALLGTIDSPDEAILLALAAAYEVPCGPGSSLREVDDGYDLLGSRMTSECAPIITTGYSLHVSRNGSLTVLGQMELNRIEGACVGRIPDGLTSVSVDRHHSVFGDHLAHCAHLEAASVVAFERLASELRRHDAPAALIDAALAAAADEVRHAHVIGTLARAHGGEPSQVHVADLPERMLEELALENATEGCVRETYGALVGAYQAEQASDGALAQAMSTIAEDEARHAALSHRVHAWAMSLLDSEARERVAAAQRHAILKLFEACVHEPIAELRARAGLPPAALATAFAGELARELWMGNVEVAA